MVRKERRRETPNPMIQKVREPQQGTAPSEGHLQRPAKLKLDTVLEPSVLHTCCLLAPQTRRCMKERPAYALSSSDDEDPSKEIGVTYKSTRSAVRTGQECGSGA